MNVQNDGFKNYQLSHKVEGVRKNSPSPEVDTSINNQMGKTRTAGLIDSLAIEQTGNSREIYVPTIGPWDGPMRGPIVGPWDGPMRGPIVGPWGGPMGGPMDGPIFVPKGPQLPEPKNDAPNKGGFWNWLMGNSADNDVDKNPEADIDAEVNKDLEVDNTLSLTDENQASFRELLLKKAAGLVEKEMYLSNLAKGSSPTVRM
ncbi:MAG: hypothetical protein VXX85_02405 [Candidatus Margulisiibacteriota bacterium]|nr:hypothetical protein [Candidatus Margulisiibacteriota bacterium]